MIRFERTRDMDIVRKILTHPAIYRHISDDFSPSADQYEPPEHESILHMLALDGDEVLGLWVFIPKNEICLEVHTNLLPNAYGERSLIAAKEMAEWIWKHTSCERIITDVPDFNRHAFKFAKRAGMSEFGCNPKSFKKDGKLWDVHMLGMSRIGDN